MTAMATCRRNCNAPNDRCLPMEISRALPRTNLQPREVPTSPTGVGFSSTKTRTPCPRNGGVPMWPSSLLKLWSLSHLPAEDAGVITVRCAALAMVVIGIAIIAHSNRL
jgi:hypothetical protein